MSRIALVMKNGEGPELTRELRTEHRMKMRELMIFHRNVTAFDPGEPAASALRPADVTKLSGESLLGPSPAFSQPPDQASAKIFPHFRALAHTAASPLCSNLVQNLPYPAALL